MRKVFVAGEEIKDPSLLREGQIITIYPSMEEDETMKEPERGILTKDPYYHEGNLTFCFEPLT